MQYTVKSGDPEKQRSACVVVGVFEGRNLPASARRLDEAAQGGLPAILRRGDIEGKTGQTLLLHSPSGLLCERLLLVGCGKEKDFHEGRYRETFAKMAKTLTNTGATEAVVYLTELEVKGHDIAWKLRHAVESVEMALYKFDRLKSKKSEKKRPLRKLVLTVGKRSELAAGETAVQQGLAISAGMHLARDLGNLPGNICTPSYLADQARELEHQYGVKTTVLEREDMEKLGMGALLSVARGSRQPPKLITIEYKGGKDDEPPVALVGKGLTFDAGGISIKPAANMDEMKYDMCGAAAVLGVIKGGAERERT